MARARLLLAVLLAASALVVLAGPATASAPSAKSRFCTAVGKIGSQTGSQPTKDQAKTLIKQFKTAGKSAPPKVKSAIGKISNYLGVIAGGDVSDLTDLAKSGTYKGYINAITTYSTYVAANCS